MAQESQQTPIPENTPAPGVLNIPDDAPPSPVEVDIEGGTATEVAPDAPPATPAAAVPRTQPRTNVRIQNLTSEKHRLEQELAQARNEAAEARRVAGEHLHARETAERAGMENLVQRTKAQVAAAKQNLRTAKDAGDTGAEVEAQAQLARAAAEEADADAWVQANPKLAEQPRVAEPQRQQPQSQPYTPKPASAPTRDFMADNPWFSAVMMGNDGLPVRAPDGRPVSNPDFDQHMHSAAINEHNEILLDIQMGTLPANYVESPEYFQRITDKVASRFPDSFEAPEGEPPAAPPQRQRAPQMAAPRQPAAPTVRQTPTQTPQRQGTKFRLDGEQAELVRSMVDNGTMIYPRNHPDAGKRGQKMSYEDAYLQYARKAQEDAKNRPQQQ